MKTNLFTQLTVLFALLTGCQTLDKNKERPKELFYETEWTFGPLLMSEDGITKNHRFKIETTKQMQYYLDQVKNGNMGEFSGPWYIDENGEQIIAEELFKD